MSAEKDREIVVSESGTVYSAQQWPPNHNTHHIGTAAYDAIAAAVRMPPPEDGEPTPAEQEDTTVRCFSCDELGTYCGHGLPND